MTVSEKLSYIAENEKNVYNAGKKSQYNEFWDAFQDYGARTDYSNAFFSASSSIKYWNDVTFKPKYNLKPQGNNSSMFRNMSVIDFPRLFENLGITLDLSMVTYFNDAFSYTETEHIGELDLSRCTQLNHTFLGCTVKIIDKLILNGPTTTSTFKNASYLEHVIVNGKISQNGFSTQWSPKLDKESIISIINSLSASSSGLTVTFSKNAVDNAFGINIDDKTTWTQEWINLRNSKSNWTFAYA